MLSHKHRFHGHGSLRYLFRNGTTSRSRCLMLRYVPNKNRIHSRVAIVISKKVFKAAVRRNRVRRRIYEIVREEWDDIKHPHDFTITVHSPETLTMTHEELQREVTSLLAGVSLHSRVQQ